MAAVKTNHSLWSLCILFPPTGVQFCICVFVGVGVSMCVCVCMHVCVGVCVGGCSFEVFQHRLYWNCVALPSNLGPKNVFPGFVKHSMLLYMHCKKMLCVMWMHLRLPKHTHTHTLYACIHTHMHSQLEPSHTFLLFVFLSIVMSVCVYMKVSTCVYLSVFMCLCVSPCVCTCVYVWYLMSAVTSQSVWAHNKRQ